MKLVITILMVATLSATVSAKPLSVSKDATIKSVLSAHKNVRVIVKTQSGMELVGEIGRVTDHVVHLKTLSGMEFFDAVVALDKIEAVLIRTKR